jgi:hypothetical protein
MTILAIMAPIIAFAFAMIYAIFAYSRLHRATSRARLAEFNERGARGFAAPAPSDYNIHVDPVSYTPEFEATEGVRRRAAS